MKVQFPKVAGVTAFGYGEKSFPVSEDGSCEIPDDEKDAIAAAQAQAQSIVTEAEGLAANEARARAGSPAGQGQEFARALIREMMMGRGEAPAPTAAAPAAAAPAAPKEPEVMAPERHRRS